MSADVLSTNEACFNSVGDCFEGMLWIFSLELLDRYKRSGLLRSVNPQAIYNSVQLNVSPPRLNAWGSYPSIEPA